MHDCAPSILIYGLDPTLLQTRQWVLEGCGYQTLTATHWSEFLSIPEQPPIDLLILCHSLDQETCSQALEVADARWPGVKHLALAANLLKSNPGMKGEAALSVGGPATLIANVNRMVGQPK